MCERDICVKRSRQSRGINADLRHVPIRECSREKRTVTPLHEHVKRRSFECWIRRVTMRFPATIKEIDFDATANWFAAVDANCSIAKIRTGLTVPNSELNDIDSIA